MARGSYRPKVFISYCVRGIDADVAKAVRVAFARNKIKVPAWRDKENLRAGDPDILKIQQGISDADYFVFMVSPRSIRSKWCRRELSRADRLGKVLIPCIVERVSEAEWPLALEERQWITLEEGVAPALPGLFKALEVLDAHGTTDDDPLARDTTRIDAFAQAFFYFASNPLLNFATAKAGLVPLALACVESERARILIQALQSSHFPNSRDAGVSLKKAWRTPAGPVFRVPPRA